MNYEVRLKSGIASVSDSNGNAVPDSYVVTLDFEVETITNNNGTFSALKPPVTATIRVDGKLYGNVPVR